MTCDCGCHRILVQNGMIFAACPQDDHCDECDYEHGQHWNGFTLTMEMCQNVLYKPKHSNDVVDECEFCLEPLVQHSPAELRSCKADLASVADDVW